MWPPYSEALPVGMDHHRHRVPAQVSLDPALERAIAGILDFLARRDRVDVGGIRLERQVRAAAAREVDDALEQVVGSLGALRLQYRIDGLEPLARFAGIGIIDLGRFEHLGAISLPWRNLAPASRDNALPGTAC